MTLIVWDVLRSVDRIAADAEQNRARIIELMAE